MAYAIELTEPAAKALAALPKNILRRVDAKILALANDPRPHGVKLLSGPDRFYRIRVGDYRVVYQIEDARLVVVVIRIGHRREVYRSR